MTNTGSLISISMLLLYGIILLWFVSIFIIRTGKIRVFIPFFIIATLFAYFGAFIFFQMYYFAGWAILKILEITAFILLLKELFLNSKYE